MSQGTPVRVSRLGLCLVASWMLLRNLPETEARRWAQHQGAETYEGSYLPGTGQLRSLLQAPSERHPRTHATVALTTEEVHAAAWRTADNVRHGGRIAAEELKTVVDTFARMLSSLDHYKGDAALFVEEVEQWPLQNTHFLP